MLQYIISIFLSIFKGFAKKNPKKHDKISGYFPFVFRTILHKQNFSKDLTNEGGCGIIIWCTAYDPLAQSVEHLTFNQGVRGSSLRWVTKKREGIALQYPLSFCRYRQRTPNPAKSSDFAQRALCCFGHPLLSAHAGVQSLRWVTVNNLNRMIRFRLFSFQAKTFFIYNIQRKNYFVY